MTAEAISKAMRRSVVAGATIAVLASASGERVVAADVDGNELATGASRPGEPALTTDPKLGAAAALRPVQTGDGPGQPGTSGAVGSNATNDPDSAKEPNAANTLPAVQNDVAPGARADQLPAMQQPRPADVRRRLVVPGSGQRGATGLGRTHGPELTQRLAPELERRSEPGRRRADGRDRSGAAGSARRVDDELDPFFRAAPASPGVQRLLASGVQHDYRVFDLDAGESPGDSVPEPWRGVVALRDPATTGTLVRWDPGSASWKETGGDEGTPLHHTWYRNPEGTYSKQLLGADGELVGALTLGPGNQVSITLDGDGDRIVDLVQSQRLELGPDGNPRLREVFLANEHGPGLRMIDELWRGRNPACRESDAKARTDGSTTSADAGPAAGAIDACGDGGRSSGADGGHSGIDFDGDRDGVDSDLGARCEGILAQGPPGPGVGLAGDSTGADWGGAVVDWIDSGFDGKEDSANTKAARTVGGGWILVGAASYAGHQVDQITEPWGLLKAWGQAERRAAGESGSADTGDTAGHSSAGGASAGDDDTAHFDTDGDGELDAKDNSGNGEADTSCADCGGSGDDKTSGKSQPAPGPGGAASPDAGYSQAEYEACARRAREQGLTEGDDPADSPVTQECDNPASDPRPYAGRKGGKAELDTYCGNRDDGESADLVELAGGDGGDDDGRCGGGLATAGHGESGCDDGWWSGGSKGTIGVAFGSVIGIDTCDPTVCNPGPGRERR